jgi:hypothetical protein
MVDVLLRPATVEGIEVAKDRVKGYDEEFVIGSNGDDDFAELAAILEALSEQPQGRVRGTVRAIFRAVFGCGSFRP